MTSTHWLGMMFTSIALNGEQSSQRKAAVAMRIYGRKCAKKHLPASARPGQAPRWAASAVAAPVGAPAWGSEAHLASPAMGFVRFA